MYTSQNNPVNKMKQHLLELRDSQDSLQFQQTLIRYIDYWKSLLSIRKLDDDLSNLIFFGASLLADAREIYPGFFYGQPKIEPKEFVLGN